MVSEATLAEIQQRTWYHQIEVAPGVITPGRFDPRPLLESMHFPTDFTGKSVLDIGAYDGYFSFEAERRGAERVLAIDRHPVGFAGLDMAKRLLGSKVEYRVASVYDLSPESFGTFDIVLFFGVLYHLRHPLLAFDKIHSVCKETLFLESQVIDQEFIYRGESKKLSDISPKLTESPIMQFYPGNELRDDISNWWSPNVECLKLMVNTSGFEIDRVSQYGCRAAMRAKRLEFTQPFYY